MRGGGNGQWQELKYPLGLARSLQGKLLYVCRRGWQMRIPLNRFLCGKGWPQKPAGCELEGQEGRVCRSHAGLGSLRRPAGPGHQVHRQCHLGHRLLEAALALPSGCFPVGYIIQGWKASSSEWRAGLGGTQPQCCQGFQALARQY